MKNDPTTKETRWRGKLTLSDVVDEAHEVKTFRFTLPGGGPIPFEYLPGQFVTLHVAPRSGPPPMMDAVKDALVSLGVPHAQIKTEAFGTIKRDPTAKDADSTEIAGRVFFLASGVTAPVSVDATILDAADTAGVSIDNACRSGTCASCRVKLVSGQVMMAVEDALTDQDRTAGYILACQAKIQGGVEVDA